jgi:AraC-like DNA-binding protein
MSFDSDNPLNLRILRQETGRFDPKLRIGPAIWPHFDLLWIHQGQVQINLGQEKHRLVIDAPGGVLIFPNTPFVGRATSARASASICHLDGIDPGITAGGSEYVPADQDRAFHIQNLINLSLDYAERLAEPMIRCRLMQAILDCFPAIPIFASPATRLDRAWIQASNNLHRIRSLSDVSAGIGLGESTFRALHRKRYNGSAGSYLKELRLTEAERLLATTGDTLSIISQSVGYAQPESFSHAFSKSRGRTPTAYRRWCKTFA